MTLTKWIPSLFLVCMGCAKPFTLTASLNNSPWFGTGDITEIHTPENQTCSIDRFSLTIRTDLPFDQAARKSIQKVTGCIDKCTPTQWLGIYQIPLTRGTYDLALPDTCLPTKVAKSSQSFTVGRASLQLMNPETGSSQMTYQFSDKDKGHIKITKLDRATGQIRGRFELTLSGTNGQTAHFTRGKFRGKIMHQ
ncbi:hypothetical protein [Spirosoma sp.]|uniref:hypothetical protein n=1 Tax=Spirosoma sp. TaxID=1899569 RepID=UPI00262FD538|nr:hypothetical protein [Spirosoma sp.]MCX6216874.1 hypothetical protein [Spirosoma sp.]